MNGFINKGSNKVYPFNSSKNIEHKGLKLFDYIETLKKNIINLFNIMQVSLLGCKFVDHRIVTPDTYEDITYTTEYNRNNGNEDFEFTDNGIYIKSMYKKNLRINLSSNVRADSGQTAVRYMRIELWRNGSMIESEFTAVGQVGNDRDNICINTFFKCTYNDLIKIKAYGKVNDTFLLTRINLELSKNNNIDYYSI